MYLAKLVETKNDCIRSKANRSYLFYLLQDDYVYIKCFVLYFGIHVVLFPGIMVNPRYLLAYSCHSKPLSCIRWYLNSGLTRFLQFWPTGLIWNHKILWLHLLSTEVLYHEPLVMDTTVHTLWSSIMSLSNMICLRTIHQLFPLPFSIANCNKRPKGQGHPTSP